MSYPKKGECRNTGRTLFKKGIIPWNKGKKIKTNTGRTHFKKGHISWITGTNIKNNNALEKYYANGGIHPRGSLGKPSWNKGKKYLKISGKKHHNWKGGITPENHKIRTSLEMKLWRKAVFKRDDYRCFDCGLKNGEDGVKGLILNADHILRFANYPNLRFEILNGRTLCVPCHKQKTRFERIGIYQF